MLLKLGTLKSQKCTKRMKVVIPQTRESWWEGASTRAPPRLPVCISGGAFSATQCVLLWQTLPTAPGGRCYLHTLDEKVHRGPVLLWRTCSLETMVESEFILSLFESEVHACTYYSQKVSHRTPVNVEQGIHGINKGKTELVKKINTVWSDLRKAWFDLNA